jgi:hypothetical protein
MASPAASEVKRPVEVFVVSESSVIDWCMAQRNLAVASDDVVAVEVGRVETDDESDDESTVETRHVILNSHLHQQQKTGADVMITIFYNFRQFSAKKMFFIFLKNQCCDQIFAKISSSLSKKRQYLFLANFSAIIF